MGRKFCFGLALVFAASSVALSGAVTAYGADTGAPKTGVATAGDAEKAQVVAQAAPAAVKAADKKATGLPKPTVTVLLRSANELFDDLKFVMGLANAPNQYETLVANIDVFLTGVDRTKLIGVRSYLTGGRFDHILSLPIVSVAQLKTFLANIDALDVKSKLVRPNVYRLSKLFEGYLYYDGAYAHLGVKEADVVAMKGAPPVELLSSYDLAVVLDNRGQTVEARRKGFDEISKEMHKAIDQSKKLDQEHDGDFKIRKTAAHQQVVELERFFVESSQLTLGWTTSAKNKNAVMNIDLSAVPETSLAASIELIGKGTEDFTGISEQGAVVVASINFPIDDLRKAHMLEMIKLSRPRAKQVIESSTKLSAAQKETDKDLTDLGFDIAEGIANTGIFDGFLRMYPSEKAGEKSVYSLLGGGKVADSEKILKILHRLADHLGKDKVKLDIAKEGDVAIHTLAVPEKQQAEFPELFTKDAIAYIGTSKNAVWFSVGDKALDRLKGAIAAPKQPGDGKSTSTALDLHGRFLPWAEMLDTRLGKTGDVQLRKQALESFRDGKDTGSLKVIRVDKDVKVHMQIDEGVLRFAGKLMAKFVKESLE